MQTIHVGMMVNATYRVQLLFTDVHVFKALRELNVKVRSNYSLFVTLCSLVNTQATHVKMEVSAGKRMYIFFYILGTRITYKSHMLISAQL